MRQIGLAAVIGASALFALCGCGGSKNLPELGQVAGTVTVDGVPVPNLVVTFEPHSAALSTGTTDAQGHYILWHANRAKGAALGASVVRINAIDDPEHPTPGGPVVIPAQYNDNSTLTADVQAGENTIDFKLVTK